MTNIAGGLITLEYAKEGVAWKGSETSRDAVATTKVQAATPVIEDIVGPVLARMKFLRRNGGKEGVLLPDRIADETSVNAVLEDEIPITDYVVDDEARIVYAGTRQSSRRFSPGRKNIAVTYMVGYPIVPQTLQDATQALVRFWIQQGVQGPAPTFGGDPGSGLSATPMGFAVPNRVMELCHSFISDFGLS